MESGVLTDFYGNSCVSHGQERPAGIGRIYRVFGSLIPLPVDVPTGTELKRVEPGNNPDPYVIYDRYGKILYQFPDDYVPTFSDVLAVCKQIGLTK